MNARHAAALRAMQLGDNAMPSRIMTAPELADYLQIHLVTLYRLVRKHQIPAFKIGTEIRFHRAAIEKWLIDRQVNG
jgi:excisionase family DNA binding protein